MARQSRPLRFEATYQRIGRSVQREWYEAGSCAKSWATSSAAAACDSSWERVKYKIAVAVEAAIGPTLLVKYSSKTVAL